MISYIALAALILTIILGVKTKLNIGIIAIGVAFVLGLVMNIPDSIIIAGFGTSLFIMLFGVMFMFGVAQVNGTIELLAKKIVFFTGRKANLIPLSLYFVGVFVAAIGPLTIPTLLILGVFSVALAKELEMEPVMLGSIAFYGSMTGGLSPIAATGIIGNQLATAIHVMNADIHFALSTLIATFVSSLIIYFLYKGYALKIN